MGIRTYEYALLVEARGRLDADALRRSLPATVQAVEVRRDGDVDVIRLRQRATSLVEGLTAVMDRLAHVDPDLEVRGYRVAVEAPGETVVRPTAATASTPTGTTGMAGMAGMAGTASAVAARGVATPA